MKIYEGKAYYGTNKCQFFDYWGIDNTEISEDDHMGYIFPEEFKDFMEKNNGKKIRLTLKWELI